MNPLENEDLSKIENNPDFFRFLFRVLLPSREPTMEAVMELFSWASKDMLEEGDFKTSPATIHKWLYDSESKGFQKKRVGSGTIEKWKRDRAFHSLLRKKIGDEIRLSPVEYFSVIIREKGFVAWEATSECPKLQYCKLVSKAIDSLINKTLRQERKSKPPVKAMESGRNRTDQKELPAGLERVFRQKPLNSSAQAKFGRVIPYFDRKEFIETHPELKGGKSEVELFVDFVESLEKLVFIVNGRGGVGKTKLSERLLSGLKVAGWTTYFMSNEATEREIDMFLNTVDRKQKYCLLLDYAEDSETLVDLIVLMHEKLADEVIEAGNLKIIATCRTSAFGSLERKIRRYRPAIARINLDRLNDQDSQKYHRWVVKEILKMYFPESWMEILPLCGDTPSIAVFFASLEDRRQMLIRSGLPRDLAQAERLFAGMRQPASYEDFRDWIDAQIIRSLHERAGDEKYTLSDIRFRLAKIYTVLPQSRLRLASGDESRIYTNRLIDDGWLQVSEDFSTDNNGSEEQYIYPPHDTFTEAIVNSWITSYEGASGFLDFKDDACRLLSDVAYSHRLRPFLATLNRCDIPDRSADAIRRALLDVVEDKRYKDAVDDALPSIFISQFAHADIKLAAIVNIDSLSKTTLNAAVRFALELKESHHPQAAFAGSKVLKLAEPIFRSDGQSANQLIRAFEIFPDLLRDAVFSKIHSGLGSRGGAFFTALLRAGMHVEDVLNPVKSWLLAEGESRGAARLLVELLRSAVPLDELEEPIRNWLSAVRGGRPNAEIIPAAPLLAERLKRGGQTQPYQEFLERWLMKNMNNPWAVRLVTLLDDETLSRQEIYGKISNAALKEFPIGGDAILRNRRVLYALKAASDLRANADANAFIGRWLELDELCLAASAQRIYSAWLERGGAPSVIGTAFKQFVALWLDEPSASVPEESWVLLFKNWIRFSSERSFIVPYAEKWMARLDFRLFFEGQDFLAEWLRRLELPAASIEKSLWDWLSNPDHLKESNSRFVLDAIAQHRAYLLDDSHRLLYQEALETCLFHRTGMKDAYWLLSDALTTRLPYRYDEELVTWFQEFGGAPENQTKVSRLLKAWLSSAPTNENLRWFLRAYFRRMIFGEADNEDEQLWRTWQSLGYPFLKDMVDALMTRFRAVKDDRVIGRILRHLRNLDDEDVTIVPFVEELVEEIKYDPARWQLVFDCLNVLISQSAAVPWINSFLDGWIHGVPVVSSVSVDVFNLVSRWDEIGRDPAELLPILRCALDDFPDRLDYRIGRSLAIWKSYLDSEEESRALDAWIMEWLEANLYLRPWWVGSFLLGLNDYKRCFHEFDTLALRWLEMFRVATDWNRNHRSFFARIMTLYLTDDVDFEQRLARARDILERAEIPFEEHEKIVKATPSLIPSLF